MGMTLVMGRVAESKAGAFDLAGLMSPSLSGRKVQIINIYSQLSNYYGTQMALNACSRYSHFISCASSNHIYNPQEFKTYRKGSNSHEVKNKTVTLAPLLKVNRLLASNKRNVLHLHAD